MLQKAAEAIKSHPIITSISTGVLVIGGTCVITYKLWYQNQYRRAVAEIEACAAKDSDSQEFKLVSGEAFPFTYQLLKGNEMISKTVMVKFISPTEIIVDGKRCTATNVSCGTTNMNLETNFPVVGKPKHFFSEVLNSSEDCYLVTGEKADFTIDKQELAKIIHCLDQEEGPHKWVLNIKIRDLKVKDADIVAMTPVVAHTEEETVNVRFTVRK